ncbi:MAG: PRC-barrel domain-containing protein [Pseudomonadota bacterium]
MMKTLTALTLSAAIVPAMTLSTAAFAAESDDMQADSEQHSSEQSMGAKPAGAIYAEDVIGQTVKHRETGEDVGQIEDLVIGDDGSIVGVVLTTSNFLGLGGQEVGLDWDQLEHTMEEDESAFYVDMDEEALRNAPEYTRE